ncbi:MAG: T9SS type A sorting domain-containing protein [Ignavibacteria bacterium]|nr:T9SS type A sorting domain-containing protein [Ignavibacteria bacterium]
MEKTKLTIIYIWVVIFLTFPFWSAGKNCVPTGPQPELIVNGNFEQGFFGFKSTYDTFNIKFPKNIKITHNPYLMYYTFDSCMDPTRPNGKFLIVNGNDIYDETEIVWEQGVKIEPWTFYEFSYMYTNIDSKVDTNKHLPIIQVSFNETFFDVVYVTKEICKWEKRSFIWFSGVSDTLIIRFRDLKKAFFGNDFALDEISLKSLCNLQACAGNDVEICEGDTIRLGDLQNQSAIQGFKPYKFNWSPANLVSSPFEPNPLAFPTRTTTFTLEVIDSLGCVSRDTVKVFVRPKPPAQIHSNRKVPICPCDSIMLYSLEGFKYLWSTGDTTRYIIVRTPGYYKLRVENEFGCYDTSGFWVDLLDVSNSIKIDTFFANTGEIITVPIKLITEKNHFVCKYDSFKIVINYNPTVLFPLNHFPKYTDNKEETLEIEGIARNFVLDTIRFFVLLGYQPSTDLKINLIQWNCDKVQTETYNGRVVIKNICTEGGSRLVDMNQKLFLSEIFIDRNVQSTAKVYFGIIEEGYTEVQVFDLLGNLISKPFSQIASPGVYTFEIQLNKLKSGTYFVVLKTPTKILTQKFIHLN